MLHFRHIPHPHLSSPPSPSLPPPSSPSAAKSLLPTSLRRNSCFPYLRTSSQAISIETGLFSFELHAGCLVYYLRKKLTKPYFTSFLYFRLPFLLTNLHLHMIHVYGIYCKQYLIILLMVIHMNFHP